MRLDFSFKDFSSDLCYQKNFRHLMVVDTAGSLEYMTDRLKLNRYVKVIALSATLSVADAVVQYAVGYSETRPQHRYSFCANGYTKYYFQIFFNFMVFFAVPLVICFRYYRGVIKVLLERKSKVQRNQNLSMTFSFSYLLWAVTWSAKYVLTIPLLLFASPLSRTLTSLSYMGWPYVTSGIWAQLLFEISLMPAIFSVLNPFVTLIINKNIRKPLSKISHKLWRRWTPRV